ncbi:MAG: hypothetical protein WA139_04175 [Candidatus Aenigmatarchaeota archaeon]
MEGKEERKARIELSDEYPKPKEGESLTSYRCRCIGWESKNEMKTK